MTKISAKTRTDCCPYPSAHLHEYLKALSINPPTQPLYGTLGKKKKPPPVPPNVPAAAAPPWRRARRPSPFTDGVPSFGTPSPSESINTSDTEPGGPAMEFRQRQNGSDASFKVTMQMIPFEIGLTNSNNSFLLSVVKAVDVQHGMVFNAVCQRQRQYHQTAKCAGSPGPCGTDLLFFLCRPFCLTRPTGAIHQQRHHQNKSRSALHPCL